LLVATEQDRRHAVDRRSLAANNLGGAGRDAVFVRGSASMTCGWLLDALVVETCFLGFHDGPMAPPACFRSSGGFGALALFGSPCHRAQRRVAGRRRYLSAESIALVLKDQGDEEREVVGELRAA
jgi:hypothetical protein